MSFFQISHSHFSFHQFLKFPVYLWYRVSLASNQGFAVSICGVLLDPRHVWADASPCNCQQEHGETLRKITIFTTFAHLYTPRYHLTRARNSSLFHLSQALQLTLHDPAPTLDQHSVGLLTQYKNKEIKKGNKIFPVLINKSATCTKYGTFTVNALPL